MSKDNINTKSHDGKSNDRKSNDTMSNNMMSCSQIIDSGLNKSYNLSKIQRKKLHTWVSDEAVANCHHCSKLFTFFNRKHHCRSCGRIFCSECCFERLSLSKKSTIKSSDSESKTKKYIESWFYGETVRVCASCNNKLSHLKKMKGHTIIFSYLDLHDLKKAGMCCKKWMSVSNKFLSEFRYIQYYLPNHKFTQKDKNMLWVHRRNFSGHSKWLMQLVKSQKEHMESNTPKSKRIVNEIINIIKKEKKVCCKYLYCSRNCNKKISQLEALELLYYNNKRIKKMAAHFLEKATNNELVLYLPMLINHMKNNRYLVRLLIDRSLTDVKLRYNLYSLLNVYSQNIKNRNNYIKIKQKLIKKLSMNDNNSVLILIETESFFKDLEFICNSPDTDYIKRTIKHIFFKNNVSGIYCPVDPEYKIKTILYDEITIINSATKPIFIPLVCVNDHGKEKRVDIIFKKEDVRADQIVINIIRISDKLLGEGNVDKIFRTYSVIPTSQETGVIEIVQNSETIYDINKTGPILNWIIENYPKEKVDGRKVERDFLISVASYCVMMYVLGVGDRHPNNLMVTTDGKFFHIDFGFFMGADPKYNRTTDSMKITPEIIKTFGGIHSKNYENFTHNCSKIYNCLRRHIGLFTILLLPTIELKDCKHDEAGLYREIIKRLVPGMTYNEAQIKVSNIIGNSQSAYNAEYSVHKMIDKIYGFNRESVVMDKVKIMSDYVYKVFQFLYIV
jgi:hypothetical protein